MIFLYTSFIILTFALSILSFVLFFIHKKLSIKIEILNNPKFKLFNLSNEYKCIKKSASYEEIKEIDELMNWNHLNTNDPLIQQKVIDNIEMKRRSIFRSCRNNDILPVKVKMDLIKKLKVFIKNECDGNQIKAEHILDQKLNEALNSLEGNSRQEKVDNLIKKENKLITLFDFLKKIHSKNNEQEIGQTLLYNHGEWIQYFDNPSPELIKQSLENNGNYIVYLDSPTKEHWKIAVQSTPDAIKLLEDQDEEIINLAIKKDPMSIQFVLNPNIDQSILALSLNQKAYKFISLVENSNPETTMQNLLKKKLILETL